MSQKTYVVTLSLSGSKSICVKAESEDEACEMAVNAGNTKLDDILDDLRIEGFDAAIEVGSAYERVK